MITTTSNIYHTFSFTQHIILSALDQSNSRYPSRGVYLKTLTTQLPKEGSKKQAHITGVISTMSKSANRILAILCLVSHLVLALAFLPVPSNVPGYRMPLTLGSMAEKVLENPKFPDEWPYSDDTDFSRQDESKDTIFYDTPRLCYHIDDDAVSALTKYYSENLKEGDDVLDICSSWVSHYPKDFKGGKVVGLGMNEYELSQNPQLTDFVVKDLNADPVFPFEDSSFDKVTCVVSVDYLNKPLQVFKEIGRVLRPGGECLISMSNRCFPTKAFKVSTKKCISLV